MRIGMGYDVHRLTEGRKLILGGVEIPFEKGLLGHSDADVLLHAIMDALLGAAAMGDIGKHFRTQIRSIKEYPASVCWSMWERFSKNKDTLLRILTRRSSHSARRCVRISIRCGRISPRHSRSTQTRSMLRRRQKRGWALQAQVRGFLHRLYVPLKNI